MSGRKPLGRFGGSSRRLLVATIIPIAVAATVVIEFRHNPGRHAEPKPLFPGFTADGASRPTFGLVVTSLQSGSEAQLEGMAVGDEVLAIDNQPVKTLDQAEEIIGSRTSDGLALRILHNEKPRDLVLHFNGVKQHEP